MGHEAVAVVEAVALVEAIGAKRAWRGGGEAGARADRWVRRRLGAVLDGTIEPGRVFERVVGPEGCRAMNDRGSIKVMIRP